MDVDIFILRSEFCEQNCDRHDTVPHIFHEAYPPSALEGENNDGANVTISIISLITKDSIYSQSLFLHSEVIDVECSLQLFKHWTATR